MLSFKKPIFALQRQLDELQSFDHQTEQTRATIHELKIKLLELTHKIYSDLSAWEVVQVARRTSTASE